MTEYKPIPGFDGYSAGKDGTIISFRKYKKGIKLKPIHKNGYLQVNLYQGSQATHTVKQVHYLVLLAWAGPPTEGQMCRHLNGNPSDNRLENLAWGTHYENVLDMIKHNRTTPGEKSGKHKLTEAQVLEILERVKTEEVTWEMAKGYGVYPSTINRIKYGERWKHLKEKVR